MSRDICPMDKKYLVDKLSDVKQDIIGANLDDKRVASGISSELKLLAICVQCIAKELIVCGLGRA